MNEKKLADKTIFITGASGDLGQALARSCAQAGAKLILHAYKNKEKLIPLSEELQKNFKTQIDLTSFDITHYEEIESTLNLFFENGRSIDAWINNAGLHYSSLLVSQSLKEIQEQVQVNLLGTIYCSKFILTHFLKNKSGTLLNMSSIAASCTSQGQAVYAATKAAVSQLTKALALEYGRKGIRVLGIEPGPLQSKMMENTLDLASDKILPRLFQKRLIHVEEVAQAVVYLLSSEATMIHGTNLVMDGGFQL